MSTPTSAAGSMPTAVSTLNRPPTLGGMSRTRIFSDRAIARSAPFSGSVTSTIAPFAFSAPNAFSSRSRTTRYCAIVSAVPPDFEVTMKSDFDRSRMRCV